MMSFDVRELRLRVRLSQRDFSKLTGISQPSVANMELGKKPLTRIHEHYFAALDLLEKNGLLGAYSELVKDLDLSSSDNDIS